MRKTQSRISSELEGCTRQLLRQSKRRDYYRGLRSEVDYKSKGSTVRRKSGSKKFHPEGPRRANLWPEGPHKQNGRARARGPATDIKNQNFVFTKKAPRLSPKASQNRDEARTNSFPTSKPITIPRIKTKTASH